MKRAFALSILISIVIGGVFAGTVRADFYHHYPPNGRPVMGLRYLHPLIDGEDISAATGTFDVFIMGLLNPKVCFILSVPYSVYKNADSTSGGFGPLFGGSDEGAVGDIYIGIMHRFPVLDNLAHYLNYGIYFATSSKKNFSASAVGIFTDLNHYARTAPYVATAQVNYELIKTNPETLDFGFKGGLQISFPTDSLRYYASEEYFIRYGAFVGKKFGKFALSADFDGLYCLTREVPQFGGSSNHTLSLRGGLANSLPVRPALFYMLHIENDTAINRVFGFNFEIDIP